MDQELQQRQREVTLTVNLSPMGSTGVEFDWQTRGGCYSAYSDARAADNRAGIHLLDKLLVNCLSLSPSPSGYNHNIDTIGDFTVTNFIGSAIKIKV